MGCAAYREAVNAFQKFLVLHFSWQPCQKITLRLNIISNIRWSMIDQSAMPGNRKMRNLHINAFSNSFSSGSLSMGRWFQGKWGPRRWLITVFVWELAYTPDNKYWHAQHQTVQFANFAGGHMHSQEHQLYHHHHHHHELELGVSFSVQEYENQKSGRVCKQRPVLLFPGVCTNVGNRIAVRLPSFWKSLPAPIDQVVCVNANHCNCTGGRYT